MKKQSTLMILYLEFVALEKELEHRGYLDKSDKNTYDILSISLSDLEFEDYVELFCIQNKLNLGVNVIPLGLKTKIENHLIEERNRAPKENDLRKYPITE